MINYNITGYNQIRRKFVIPIGNITKEEAKISMHKLMSSYKEDINFNVDKGLVLRNIDISKQTFYPNIPVESKENALKLQLEILQIYTEKVKDDHAYFRWDSDNGYWVFNCGMIPYGPSREHCTLEDMKNWILSYNFMKTIIW